MNKWAKWPVSRAPRALGMLDGQVRAEARPATISTSAWSGSAMQQWLMNDCCLVHDISGTGLRCGRAVECQAACGVGRATLGQGEEEAVGAGGP